MRRSTASKKRKQRNRPSQKDTNPTFVKGGIGTESKAKSAFIANISHEIRTPMNAIMGFAQMLKSTKLTEQQSDYVDVIIDSGKKLLLIIGNLLDISNLQLGKTTINPRPCHPEIIIGKLWHHFEPLIAGKNLNPIYECVSDMPELIIDCEKVERVAGYILSNAIKYTATGHITLRVCTRPVSDNEVLLCIDIADSGIGIPEEKLVNIFEVFEQADNSITRPFSGMGIGLGLSKQLVSLLGGKIKVQSIVGEGSRFLIEIPAPVVGSPGWQ